MAPQFMDVTLRSCENPTPAGCRGLGWATPGSWVIPLKITLCRECGKEHQQVGQVAGDKIGHLGCSMETA